MGSRAGTAIQILLLRTVWSLTRARELRPLDQRIARRLEALGE
jgi:hypothetical protein